MSATPATVPPTMAPTCERGVEALMAAVSEVAVMEVAEEEEVTVEEVEEVAEEVVGNGAILH